MTAHMARAVRREGGNRFLWHAVCSDGCQLRQVNSKEAAEWEAARHMVLAAAVELPCHCWVSGAMEQDPAGLCPRCRIFTAMGHAA